MIRAGIRPGNIGLGQEEVHEVTADDDDFDTYRKRMMLAYKYRPNPLVGFPFLLYMCCCSNPLSTRIIPGGHITKLFEASLQKQRNQSVVKFNE